MPAGFGKLWFVKISRQHGCGMLIHSAILAFADIEDRIITGINERVRIVHSLMISTSSTNS
jgi:hypothetical protein